MTRVLSRAGLVTVSALLLSFAMVAACSSSDPSTAGPDGSTADGTADGSGNVDTGTATDSGGDAGSDTGSDSAEAEAPRLCKTYPNVSADASPTEGPRKLYELIALRALFAAIDSCEIGQHFLGDLEDPPPSQITCFGKQLAAVAGCLAGGAPINYATEIDENGERCVLPGTGVVQIGFRDPATNGYSTMDVDFMTGLVQKAALSTGMPTADADRLKTLIAAEKSKAAGDAGPGYTKSTCP